MYNIRSKSRQALATVRESTFGKSLSRFNHLVRNHPIGTESSLSGCTQLPKNQPAFRNTSAITRVPEPPVAPMTTGGGADGSRGGTFREMGNARERRSSQIAICCNLERGVLPIFKSRRIRSKELRNCEPFTFIESVGRVKMVAAFHCSKSHAA